jgi:hypothetical protein
MDDKAKLKELSPITIKMVHLWERGDRQGCYRQFFALSMEDRQLVRECFKGMRKFPLKQARKTAKGIFNMLEANYKKEVGMMVDAVKDLLYDWFFNGKEVFYSHYCRLSPFEQAAIREALAEVIADSTNDEFQQAAKDIPVFLASKESVVSS